MWYPEVVKLAGSRSSTYVYRADDQSKKHPLLSSATTNAMQGSRATFAFHATAMEATAAFALLELVALGTTLLLLVELVVVDEAAELVVVEEELVMLLLDEEALEDVVVVEEEAVLTELKENVRRVPRVAAASVDLWEDEVEDDVADEEPDAREEVGDEDVADEAPDEEEL